MYFQNIKENFCFFVSNDSEKKWKYSAKIQRKKIYRLFFDFNKNFKKKLFTLYFELDHGQKL